MPDITIAKLDEIAKGLEGVTEGPWFMDPMDGGHRPRVSGLDGRLIACVGNAEPWFYAKDRWEANAAHIARCDRDTIRELVRLARIGLATEANYRDLLVYGISITRIAPADVYAKEPQP